MREGAIGPALDYSQAAVVVEFNDVSALERALQAGDIAAVIAEPDEEVVFSFVEWPSKAVRDAAFGKMMEDPRMEQAEMPFSGQRLIYGGFASLVDTLHDAPAALGTV